MASRRREDPDNFDAPANLELRKTLLEGISASKGRLELGSAVPDYSPDRAPAPPASPLADRASPPIPHQSPPFRPLVAQPIIRRSVYPTRSLALGDHASYTNRHRCPLA